MSPRVYRNLDEIFAGEYEGMRYDDIKALAPGEAELRAMDKIGYRYPRGARHICKHRAPMRIPPFCATQSRILM